MIKDCIICEIIIITGIIIYYMFFAAGLDISSIYNGGFWSTWGYMILILYRKYKDN